MDKTTLLKSPNNIVLTPLSYSKSPDAGDKPLRMVLIYISRKLSSRTSISTIYIISLKTILLLASISFGLCDSSTHGFGSQKHLELQLAESKTPANSPPYCIYLPPSGSVPLPFSSSPPHYAPEPPAFNPPLMTHPSPPIPTPPYKKPENVVWCVAKPTVPEVLLQPALDYACGSGAGCEAKQRNGVCFQPDTVLSHAFNSYWQKTKQAGATCESEAPPMLVYG